MSTSKTFLDFCAYLRKFLLIIPICSLLLYNSEIFAQSFSNNITCSFNPAPDEELFFCGSQVTATINIVNLDPTYSDLHFLFPTQFQLVSINGVAPTVSTVIEQLTINDLNPTPTVYNMQHSSFSLQNPTTYVMIFNVLPCLNGDDVSDEGALFEMYVLNGNGGRIDAIFNQQIIQGGNGFTEFTSFSDNAAILTTITPVPQFAIPDITYFNEFDPQYNAPVHYPWAGICDQDPFIRCVDENYTPPEYCVGEGSALYLPAEEEGGWQARDLARLLVADSLQFINFAEESYYDIKRSLARMMADSLLSLPDSAAYLQLKNEISSSSIPDFNAVDYWIKKQSVDTTIASQASYFLNRWLTYADSLNEINYNSIISNNWSDSSISIVRYNILDSILFFKSQLSLIDNGEQIKRTLYADSADARNAAIEIEMNKEAYERAINEVYLGTCARGVYKFDETQKQDITFIAGLCPLLGGDAVFKARSLLALFNDSLIFDDVDICYQSGYSYRIAGQDEIKNNPKLILFPNPVKHVLNIEIKNLAIENEYDVFVFNNMGALVTQLKRSSISFSVDCNQINLSSGLYFIEIRTANESFRERFIYAK